MNEEWNLLIKQLPKLLNQLTSQPLRPTDDRGVLPKKGVYVFYEKDKAIYVGRSNRLKSRIQQHGRQSSMHNSASLAFRMAKEEMARLHDIPKDITRKELEEAPGFDMLFFNARLRVAQMKIRVIGINDQVTQALFEIYAALALNTKYNDFSTH